MIARVPRSYSRFTLGYWVTKRVSVMFDEPLWLDQSLPQRLRDDLSDLVDLEQEPIMTDHR